MLFHLLALQVFAFEASLVQVDAASAPADPTPQYWDWQFWDYVTGTGFGEVAEKAENAIFNNITTCTKRAYCSVIRQGFRHIYHEVCKPQGVPKVVCKQILVRLMKVNGCRIPRDVLNIVGDPVSGPAIPDIDGGSIQPIDEAFCPIETVEIRSCSANSEMTNTPSASKMCDGDETTAWSGEENYDPAALRVNFTFAAPAVLTGMGVYFSATAGYELFTSANLVYLTEGGEMIELTESVVNIPNTSSPGWVYFGGFNILTSKVGLEINSGNAHLTSIYEVSFVGESGFAPCWTHEPTVIHPSGDTSGTWLLGEPGANCDATCLDFGGCNADAMKTEWKDASLTFINATSHELGAECTSIKETSFRESVPFVYSGGDCRFLRDVKNQESKVRCVAYPPQGWDGSPSQRLCKCFGGVASTPSADSSLEPTGICGSGPSGPNLLGPSGTCFDSSTGAVVEADPATAVQLCLYSGPKTLVPSPKGYRDCKTGTAVNDLCTDACPFTANTTCAFICPSTLHCLVMDNFYANTPHAGNLEKTASALRDCYTAAVMPEE